MLTTLTVITGEASDGERAFFKSARATQQAGAGIARYLPGLPEKARDWQAVTERLKDGERLVRARYMAAVYAPVPAIDEAEQAVRVIYHGHGWRVNAERYVQLPFWLACSTSGRWRFSPRAARRLPPSSSSKSRSSPRWRPSTARDVHRSRRRRRSRRPRTAISGCSCLVLGFEGSG